MKKLLIATLSIVILIGSFLFYWYEVKPLLIKKSCVKYATQQQNSKSHINDRLIEQGVTSTFSGEIIKSSFDTYYEKCIREKAL